MTPLFDRRRFITSALGCAGVAALPALGVATRAFAQAAGLEAKQLADGLSLLTGAGGNVLALSADEGLVLVDAGAPDRAEALRAALRDLPNGDAVRTVINTHYHADQTGGNALMAGEGATILAHERTKTWMSYPIWSPEELAWSDPRPAEARPTETFYLDGQMTAGGQTIDYGYLVDAHTDSDIYVFFREANVLAVGDVASPDRDPVFDWFAGGWLGGRIDAQARLIEMADENTQIVPSYGPVMTRAELAAEQEMLTTLFDRVHAMFRNGRSAADFVAEGALDGLPRTFSDPDTLMYDVHKGLWGHQDALAHDIV